MKKPDLKAIKRRCELATVVPWVSPFDAVDKLVHKDLPALIDEVERLQEIERLWEQACDDGLDRD